MLDENLISVPAHYVEGRTIEPIQVIESLNFSHHLACVVEYISRVERKKPPLEELKKAEWYLERALRRETTDSEAGIFDQQASYKPKNICDDWRLSTNLRCVLINLFRYEESNDQFLKVNALDSALMSLREEITVYEQLQDLFIRLESEPNIPENKRIEKSQKSIEIYLSFADIEPQLKEQIYSLATHLLGPPNKSKAYSDFIRFGKKNEISIGIEGERKGVYTNFETGVKGGPLKLIEEQKGLSFPRETLEWARDWLGNNSLAIQKVAGSTREAKKSTWTPITPIPDDVEFPDIAGNKYLNFMLKDGFELTARYPYRDAVGNLKGYVVRFEKEVVEDNKVKIVKSTLPLAYCENENGLRYWKWQGLEKENKTPYGIEKLAQDPHKPILVVEGEKTADAAQKLLPEYHVLTWGSGAGNVDKTNWMPLVGKTVIIWPDHDYDQGGQKAAQKLQKIVEKLNKDASKEGRIGIVQLPVFLPDKWDLADPLPEGWSLETIHHYLNSSVFNLNQSSLQNVSEKKRKS